MRAPPRIALIVLAFLGYVSLGLPDAVVGVAWPFVRQTFGLPISALGALLAVATAGYLTASFTSGRIVRRAGVGWVLAGSSLTIAVGLVGYALAPAWPAMVALGLLAGAGAGGIDVALNGYAAEHFRPRLMVWLHGCWGVGATIGPLVMTAAITGAAGGGAAGWRWGYGWLAFILFALSVAFIVTVRWWDDDVAKGTAKPQAADGGVGVFGAMALPAVWLNALLFFVYTGLEAATGAWMFSVMTESRGVPRGMAGTAIAIYWASITAGRLVIGSFANRVPVATILRVATVVAPAAAAALWLTADYRATVAGLVVLGFALAPMFPLWMSQTPGRLGRDVASHAIGFQVSAACVGIAAIPGAVGVLAKWRGLEAVPPVLVGTAALLLGLHELARWRDREASDAGAVDALSSASPQERSSALSP